MSNKNTILLLVGICTCLHSTLLSQCPLILSAGADKLFCSPAPAQTVLNGSIDGKYLFYTWTPTTGFIPPYPHGLNPAVLVNQSTTYTLGAWVLGPNLAYNGNFDEGPKVPYTDLNYSPGDISQAGTYDVVDNPKLLNPTFSGCSDPDGKTSNMLIFRGTKLLKAVWCQTFSVEPNTFYTISFYATLVNQATSTPSVSISFNGDKTVYQQPFPSVPCRWEHRFASGDSGNSTTMDVCFSFEDMNDGQVIAVDNIEFYATCYQQDTVNIVVAPEVNAVASPPYLGIPSCKETTTVTLNGAGSSTGPNIKYNWQTADGNIVSGQNTLTPVVDASGTYTLVVTYEKDGLQCTKTAETEIQFTNPLQAYINQSPNINCAVDTVSLIGGATLPGPNQFQWTATNGGNIVSGANSFLAKANQPGDYTLVVTNVNTGCTAQVSTNVAVDTIRPLANATAPPLLCSQQQTTLSGAGSSTGSFFTYGWSSPDSSGNIVSGQDSLYATVNSPGMYVLLVTNNSNKCVRADTVLVARDTLAPEAAIETPGQLNCTTDTLILSAAVTPANALLAWTTSAGGNIVGATDTSFVVVTTPAVYSLTITNPVNGCTAIVADTILLNDNVPEAVIEPPGTITCEQSNVTISAGSSSAGPGIVYTWTTTANGNIVSGGDSLSPVVNGPGTYTLLVTNTTNTCTASASVTVDADTSAVVAVANAPTPLTCVVNSALLNANGSTAGPDITYQWTTTDGLILNGANSGSPLAGAAGTYTLLITNTTNGCTSTDLAVLNADVAAPGANLAVSGNINCNNTSVELQSSGTANPSLLEHTWTNPDNSAVNTGADPSLEANAPGTYQVLVTNTQNGCTSTASINVIAFENVTGNIVSQTNIACFGDADGAIEAAISGGDGNYTYLWNNDQTTLSVTGLEPGNYTLTATDGEGCSVTISATITQPDALTAISSATAPSVVGAADGTASVSPAGGTPGYTYEWSNDETTQNITGLTSGFYTVTVTDANGCTAVLSVEVGEGNCSLSADFSTNDPRCNGASDGQATAMIIGGTAPVTYAWSNNSTQQTATGLGAGTYTVVATDANGCEISGAVTLTDPPLLTLDLTEVNSTSCALAEEGSATVLAGGGSGTVSILWSNDQTGATANNLPAGTYTATATDINGCTATVSATVIALDQTPPVIQATATTVPVGPSGSVTLTPLNVGATATDNCSVASVSFVPAAFDCSDLGVHTVTLTATDGSGNSSSVTIEVTIIDNTPPTLTCASDITRCAGDDVVEYNAPVATDNCLGLGGQFALVSGLPSGSVFPTGATTNTYTFADAQGNVGSCSFVVTLLTPLVTGLDSVIHDIDNQGIGGVQVTVSGSQPGYTYLWLSNGQPVATTEDLVGVGAGLYTLVTTDAAGCSLTAGPFSVSNVSGTNDPALKLLVGVFPNPTGGQLFAAFPAELAGAEKYFAVYDATGRKVMEQYDNQQQQVRLDLSQFSDGLYSVLIRTAGMQGTWNIVLSR